jgi:RNA polymerase sigma-70 factor (ECF subfamily)
MRRIFKTQSHVVRFPSEAYHRRRAEDPNAVMSSGGLEAVFFENRTLLLRFLRARGAGADAEDILQELWIRVSGLQAQGPIADPLSYIHRMADNLMHDRHRSAERRRQREAVWDTISGPTLAGISDEPSAERALLARERLDQVESALEELSDRAQTIFRRFRLDGASHRIIAGEQGISVSAVEKQLQRAYRAIMVKLSGKDEDANGAADGESGGRRDASDR